MINVDELKRIFKECKVFSKETSKNFIIRCPYCGDRGKKGGHHDHEHCYVSKLDATPTYHCFYCNASGPITKLLFDLTGKNDSTIVKIEKYIKKSVKVVNTRHKVYKIPELDLNGFPSKRNYMINRTFGKLDVKAIPNLIFDLQEFFALNNIDVALTKWEMTLLQHNFVCFLSKHHTMLYCRNINPNTEMKFKKIFLQKDQEGMLDYYELDLKRPDSNTIIMSEGNFDILGCYANDSLKLNSKANCYVSGCTFSYGELLKSVCYDKSVYQGDIYILSDSDKKHYHYKKFLRNSFTASSVNIVYNRFGKDFGERKQEAIKVF